MEGGLPRASYHFSQYVVIQDRILCNELKVGQFGTNYLDAKRKDGSRQGPADRLISKLNLEADKDAIILTLHEAFFLIHSSQSLILEYKGENLNVQTCWNEFRRYNRETNIALDFAVEYGVYHHFRLKGWVVKSGFNYGSDFILYDKGPSLGHAQYTVKIIYPQDDGSRCNYIRDSNGKRLEWDTLLVNNRIANSVGKKILLAYVTIGDEIPSRFFEDYGCVHRMTIVTRVLSVYQTLPVNKTG